MFPTGAASIFIQRFLKVHLRYLIMAFFLCSWCGMEALQAPFVIYLSTVYLINYPLFALYFLTVINTFQITSLFISIGFLFKMLIKSPVHNSGEK